MTANTNLNLRLGCGFNFSRNFYFSHSASPLSRQQPVALSNRSAVRTMCEIIIYVITRSVNGIIKSNKLPLWWRKSLKTGKNFTQNVDFAVSNCYNINGNKANLLING